MLKDIKPDAKVDVVVLRKTRKEMVKGLTLPKAKEVPGNFNFPNIPFNPPGGLGGVTTLNRNNDAFTIRNKQGDLTIEVTGKVEDGKAKADEIKITEGDKTSTYTSVDKVPEKHRDQVIRLVEAAGKNRVRFQFRTPRREEN